MHFRSKCGIIPFVFGINKKLYTSLSILSIIAAVVFAFLAFIDFFNQQTLMFLSSVAMILLSLCLILKPTANLLKITNEFMKNIRVDFYKELENKDENFDSINVFEKEGVLYLESYDGLCFKGLSYEEALYIIKKLIKEYVIIRYSLIEDNKVNLKKATVENFKIIINKQDNIKEEIYIVKEYEVLK